MTKEELLQKWRGKADELEGGLRSFAIEEHIERIIAATKAAVLRWCISDLEQLDTEQEGSDG